MKEEKLFPISVNRELCVRCQRCMYSCSPKAIFFNNSMRYVNYDKCQGCLKCVDVCEHGAIEVISMEEGKLKGFTINQEECKKCGTCTKEGFCLNNLFEIKTNEENGEDEVSFKQRDGANCFKCLKCFKSCPNNAIVPIIEED